MGQRALYMAKMKGDISTWIRSTRVAVIFYFIFLRACFPLFPSGAIRTHAASRHFSVRTINNVTSLSKGKTDVPDPTDPSVNLIVEGTSIAAVQYPRRHGNGRYTFKGELLCAYGVQFPLADH